MADDEQAGGAGEDGPAWGPGIFLIVAAVALLWMGADLCTGGKLTAFAAGAFAVPRPAEASDGGT